jgi:hypothetical protein
VCFACGPYSDSDVAGPGVNEELVAMLDYYVAVSLSAEVAHAEQFKPYIRMQVLIYKAFNGTSGRESWRPQLLAVS